MRRIPIRLAVAASLFAATGSAQALVVHLDDLLVVRDGSIFFHDSFGDGLPPPSVEANTEVCGAQAPNCYGVFGAFPAGAESGGRLRLDTAAGLPSESSLGTDVVTQRIRLVSNRSDAPEDASRGLKIGRAFSASAVFDLVVPGPGDSYTLRFEDMHANEPAANSRNDYLQLQVRRSSTAGALPEIALRKQDFIADSLATIASTPLDLSLGADQIRLTLEHGTANSTQVHASWAYLAGGAVVAQGAFSEPGTIFTGETFTRVAVLATALPVPEPATWATMLFGLGMLGWRLRGGAVDRRRG
jgi:hypothetical protein